MGFGKIPDGTSSTPGSFGSPLNIGIPVSGFVVGDTPKKIAVTVALQHQRVGDLEIKLIAPPPGNQEKVLLSRTGAETGGSLVGSSANLDGTYTFTDSAPSDVRWWDMAAATPDARAVPIGNYRASDAGPDGGANATILSAPLSGVTNMNGTWTLSITDGTAGDGTGAVDPRGQVNFASLELVGKRQVDSPGAIPDDSSQHLDVPFPITGLAAAAPSAITLSMTFEPNHTWVGDLDVSLIAPDGTEGALFTRTGGGAFGDSSDLDGPYQFLDVVGAFNWWAKAAAAGDTTPVESGAYRASDVSGADTSLVGLFSGVTNPNGTWILRFHDHSTNDTGGVSFATLDVRTGTDNTAPATPSFTGSVPASPSNSNQPKIKGTAESGSFVRLYADDPFCSADDLLVATGTAATFASTGIELPPVPSDAPTTIYAEAYDSSGNVSGCTPAEDALIYTEDSTAPATPAIAGTDPPSPANNNDPKLKGSGAEDGSTVRVYDNATCTEPAADSGDAADFNAAGITVHGFPDDEAVTLYVAARDAAGNVSGCSNPITYVEDSTAPPTPTLDFLDPHSPANNRFPKLLGLAELGSTITVHDGAVCTGPPVFVGPAADLNGGGLQIEVPPNETNTYRVTATDAAGNVSGCSNGVAYTEDSIAPAAPVLSGTDPPSGADQNKPKVQGIAEAGSSVSVYPTPDCTGQPLGVATAENLGDTGIEVSVNDNSTTSLSALAMDAAGNVSGCSAPITYSEVTPIPGPGPDLLAPETTITSAPKATVKTKRKSASYSIEFSANEPATFKCSFDQKPFAPCSSPATGKAKKGAHTFSVIATDNVGNADPTPATAAWKVKRKKRRH
jgi:subtilisin-like proprotein convertase family protein